VAHAAGGRCSPQGGGFRESNSTRFGRGRSSNGREKTTAADPPAPGPQERCRVFPEGPGAFSAIAPSEQWATEPDVGRVAYGVPARVDRLRGLGNAVVPQVAEWIGRRVVDVECTEATRQRGNEA
jgi:DNA (cytosine-5)-methyltransferase 1